MDTKLNVKLIAYTPNAEEIVANCAKLCYSPAQMDDLLNTKLSQEETQNFVKKLIDMGHFSTVEHVNFTFAIEGISRACSHQLVRHRIASYCLTGDTFVFSDCDRKFKKIEEIYNLKEQSQEMLRCIDESKKMITTNKVKSVIFSGEQLVYEVITEHEYVIKSTLSHKYFTQDGWKELSEININDLVYIDYEKGVKLSKVVSIKYVGVEKTYDIEMESPHHNFIANGFVVHNSQQSQRYVSEQNGFDFIIPPSIKGDERLEPFFLKAMEKVQLYYNIITINLTKKYVNAGMDEKKARKKAIEDARFVLPNACETKIIVTMNARTLHHFFNKRCCNNAQWEIRLLAREMLSQARVIAPNVFANCGADCELTGKCNEGNLTCGKPYPRLTGGK